MSELIGSLMPMQADIYTQASQQDLNTGSIKKVWSYVRTIDCAAKGNITRSGTSGSNDKQSFSNKYENQQIVEIRSKTQINYREKINNIRDSAGNVIWKELNYPTETPTVFEVISSTPVTDPFGNVIAYNSIAKRSENQEIGL
jgi:hypothetical protein